MTLALWQLMDREPRPPAEDPILLALVPAPTLPDPSAPALSAMSSPSAADPDPDQAPSVAGAQPLPDDIDHAPQADAEELDRPDEKKEEEDKEDPEHLQHVRGDWEDEDVEVEADKISTVDHRADEDTRHRVFDLPWAEDNPATTSGATSASGGTAGSKVTQKSGGEQSSQPTEAGAPGAQGGPKAAGEQSPSQRAGGQDGEQVEGRGASARSQSASASTAESVGGERGEAALETPSQAPDGWEPLAVRVIPHTSTASWQLQPEVVQEQRQEQDPQQAREPERAQPQGDQGEAQQADDAVAELERSPEQGTAPTPDPRSAPSADQGWEAAQIPKKQGGDPGKQGRTGTQASTTPTVVDQDIKTADLTDVSTRAHPHAAYLRSVEEQVSEQWRANTPVEIKAMGLQGTSGVLIHIDSRGRVVHKKLVRRSGYDELDSLALSSIPKRLPRPPEGAADPVLEHTINLRVADNWASDAP